MASRDLAELFAVQAEKTPDAVALRHGETEISYRVLWTRSRKLARWLERRGVGPETLVGLCLPRSIDMVVALLAVWEAGGAYVPLDPTYPTERLGYMMSDSRVSVVLTTERVRELLRPSAAELVALDASAIATDIDAQSLERVAPRTPSGSLAYVIYTSGSTGRPKGAMLSRAAVAAYFAWATKAYGADAGEGAPVHSSLSFDLTVTSLLVPLLGGLTVTLVHGTDELSGFVEALRARRDYTLLKLTPAHLGALSHLLRPEELRGMTRLLVVGGEQLAAQSVRPWREHAPDTRIVNEYGPTETVVGCCIEEVRALDGDVIAIGKATPGTVLHVVDETLQRVSVGATGELCIAGAQLGRGYLGKTDLTAARFVPNPFAAPGERMYRTGDLARQRADGTFEYLGRLDDQVKIRGYRVELGEVELALRHASGAGASVVVAQRDATGHQRLVAYVVGDVDVATLRTSLRASLPEYMVPAAIVALPALPLTPNGKVDRKALPAPERTVGLAPRNVTEATLARVWEEAMSVGPIGVDEDFFDLGGTSMTAVVIVERIRKAFGVELPINAIARAGTIGSLARIVVDVRPTDAWSPLVEIKRGTGRPIFFLHTISGEIVGYFALARRLDVDLPMYGLQASGLARGTTPLTSVEDMAALYLAEVRKAQPVGPYRFVGHSFGAVLAFEMAQQLARAGEKTDLLVNMDQWFPMESYKTKFLPRLAGEIDPSYVLDRLMFFFQVNGLKLDPRHLATVMSRPAEEQVAAALEIGVSEKVLPEGFDAEQLRCFLRLYVAHIEALRAYDPAPYQGRMTLLRCDHPSDPPSLGWDRVCDDIDMIPVRGQHSNLLQKTESLDEIGSLLTSFLSS